MVGHFPLEGDGCVHALFHYIWNKNPHKKSCPLVNVPDTVVYKYRQPAYWYFTSKDPAGGVKMKNKTNREFARASSSFCASASVGMDLLPSENPISPKTAQTHTQTLFAYYRAAPPILT
jgi:hypothetical protein